MTRRQDLKQGQPRLSNTDAPSMNEILHTRVSRRDTLRGGLGLAAGTFFAGAGISGCNSEGGKTAAKLSFSSVPGSTDADMLIVPPGFTTDILAPWGTPITGSFPAFKPDGTNSAEEQAQQMGQNHDGMQFYPLDDSGDRGLLVMNHEYSNATLFPGDGRSEDANGAPTDPDQVRKDINAHGVAIIEVQRDSSGKVSVVQGSSYNRRITAATPMQMSGPAAGDALLRTAYDPTGMSTRGTVNNCARGHTPWGTYLACEENIQGYFINTQDNPPRETARMGINAEGFGYLWSNVAGDPSEVNGEFARFDTTPSAASATADYRNEANNFGWVVEIDPKNPASTPIKRTALGRMRHEGCEPGLIRAGEPIAFYMGDDDRFEYFYKFVTAENYTPGADASNMLDNGTLYVARFNADGSGEWLKLDYATNPALQNDFASQADVLVNTRTAADILGATPMDRPEWSTTDPATGEIYLTLTNNTRREEGDENAANPRAPNSHGHVIRLAEDNSRADATSFSWDIFLFASNANADADFNKSGLTQDNELGSPDGIWFDPRGVLWIQTDNGAPLDFGGNDQMLAVVPASLSGDRTINPQTQAELKRFFVGPAGCEVTGVTMTPDYRTMFVNIQHPGGSFPANDGSSRPRSTTVVIRREDGGEVI